jgi:hypothetical protein
MTFDSSTNRIARFASRLGRMRMLAWQSMVLCGVLKDGGDVELAVALLPQGRKKKKMALL